MEKYFKKTDYIVGRNSVIEALKSDNPINFILISDKFPQRNIFGLAKSKNIAIKKVSITKLDSIANGINHQGIAAQISAKQYSSIEEILNTNKPAFILITDKISDPYNFGAMIRTAECFGVNGVITRKQNSVLLTAGVAKSSCGALEFMKISRVTNLVKTIEYLKSQKIWICAADAEGQNIFDEKKTEIFTSPIALVIGSEHEGISKLVKTKCDFIFSIPMFGKISSLNASVAAGIFMYKIAEKRKCK
ncbi:MAG: 23S rRNA (guanosine(2251)-2'-O)-methyltransferase RlmB [Oscillospiraceae bacterium]|jgi:23S rRNA (guanosine2251-2'-O)-methyltransferase|nr:23S rRNA (guanosine(2251)-2'-O)-methyltransferase RlmB [Oscillospiraceae bacterium]